MITFAHLVGELTCAKYIHCSLRANSTGVGDLNQQSEQGAYYAGVVIGAENHVLTYFPVNRLNSP